MQAIGRQVFVWWGGSEHDHKHDCYLRVDSSYRFAVKGARAGAAIFRSFNGTAIALEWPGSSEWTHYPINDLIAINALPGHGPWD